jgi:hypothetical protein
MSNITTFPIPTEILDVMPQAEGEAGIATTYRLINAEVLKASILAHALSELAGTTGQMLVKASNGDLDTEWSSGPILSNYTETLHTETLTANTTIDLADGPIQLLTINPAGASVEIALPAGTSGKTLTLIIINNTGKAHTWAASPNIVWMSESNDATPPTPAADNDRTSYGFVYDGTAWLGWLTGKEVSA